MDNNFNQNQQAPIQAQPQQQAPIQAQPQPQQQYSNPFGQTAVKTPANFNLFELISIICSGVGMLMVFIGSILTCTCSAKKSVGSSSFTMSPIFVLTIFGILVAAAGVVLAILAIKDTKNPVKAGMLAKIAVALGAFAVLYGLIPMITVCGYNCSLNNAVEDYRTDALKELENLYK